MKKILLGAIVALLPLTGFSATILGFQAGVGMWSHDPSGGISTTADAAGVSADLNNDLKLSSENESYSYFLVEHPVPLIPNFKYINSKLTSSGASGSANFTYDTFNYTTSVNTTLDLSQTDMIFYYEILDNSLVSLDLGLVAKVLKGKVVVDTNATNINATIPLLYAYAEVGLPSDFSIAGEIQALGAGSNSITDITAKVMYTMDSGLGLEAGLRTQSYSIDTNNVKASVTFSGIFAGAFYRF